MTFSFIFFPYLQVLRKLLFECLVFYWYSFGRGRIWKIDYIFIFYCYCKFNFWKCLLSTTTWSSFFYFSRKFIDTHLEEGEFEIQIIFSYFIVTINFVFRKFWNFLHLLSTTTSKLKLRISLGVANLKCEFFCSFSRSSVLVFFLVTYCILRDIVGFEKFKINPPDRNFFFFLFRDAWIDVWIFINLLCGWIF